MGDFMSQEHPFSEPLLVELRSEIKSLSENVIRLTSVVDENTKQLNRLAVLENNHAHHSEAIGRAFSSMEVMQSEIKENFDSNAKEHSVYFKYVWMAVGFCVALTFMWTLFGYRINFQLDEHMKIISEMRAHILTDKVMNERDVREAIK